MRQLRPISTPRGIRARLPTSVIPAYRRSGSSRFGGRSVADTDLRAGADARLLVDDGAVQLRPRSMTASNMTIESRTTAPAATRTPGDSTLCSTVPSTTQPWLIIERDDARAGADSGRGPLLGLRVDQPAEVVELDAGSSLSRSRLVCQ